MEKQKRLYKVKDMFVDRYVLEDASCSLLFELGAYHKIRLHLVLPQETCLKDVEQLDSFGYVGDVVYECSVQAYVSKHYENSPKDHIAIFEKGENELVFTCMEEHYKDVEAFLIAYSKQERRIKRWLVSFFVVLIAYFTIYFYNIDALPIYMRSGWTLLLYMLLPASLLMIGMLYGIHRRIFSIWQLLDWI